MNEAIKQWPGLESTEDLTAFANGRELYNRVERAWKRGYLLYGPPGSSKSNLIEAMANYLCGLQNTTNNACCHKPALCMEGTFLVREGDPVNEMVFILRGHLDSYTAGGGHTGFFNSCHNGHGDFGGEELVTYALDACSSSILPSSTCTIKAITEVDRAFATVAHGAGHPAELLRTKTETMTSARQ
jgi:DNA polymerase III delta prime subunit